MSLNRIIALIVAKIVILGGLTGVVVWYNLT